MIKQLTKEHNHQGNKKYYDTTTKLHVQLNNFSMSTADVQ